MTARAASPGMLVIAAFVLAACGGGQRAAERGPRAVVRVSCNVPDALLYVDDRYVGEVRDVKRGIGLLPGYHRLEIRREGYHARYVEVTLAENEVKEIRVELLEVLD